MATSRIDVLKQYEADFKKRLSAESSQECINHLLQFLDHQMQVPVFDPEVSANFYKVLMEINRFNRRSLEKLSPVEEEELHNLRQMCEGGLLDKSNARLVALEKKDQSIEQDTNKLVGELFKLIKQTLAKLQLKDKKQEEDTHILEFLQAILKKDKGFQKLTAYERILKDSQDDTDRKKEARMNLQVTELKKHAQDIIAKFQVQIHEMYGNYGVKNLEALKLKHKTILEEQKKLQAGGSADPTYLHTLEVRAQMMSDHINFITAAETGIKQIQLELQSPQLAFEKINDLLSELIKLPGAQSKKESASGFNEKVEAVVEGVKETIRKIQPIKQLLEENKEKGQPLSFLEILTQYKKNLLLQPTDTQHLSTLSLIDAYTDMANFPRFFGVFAQTLNNYPDMLAKVSTAYKNAEGQYSIAELKTIAAGKLKDTKRPEQSHKKDAVAILLLIEKLALDESLDNSVKFILNLSKDFIYSLKSILGLPPHLIFGDIVTSPQDLHIFSMIVDKYLNGNYDVMVQQVGELKRNLQQPGADNLQLTADEKATAVEKAIAIIATLESYKRQIMFLLDKTGTLFATYYFKLPAQIKTQILGDRKTVGEIDLITTASFLMGKDRGVPQIQNIKGYQLDEEGRAMRNAKLNMYADTNIQNLNTLFNFREIKDLIISGRSFPVVKELIEAVTHKRELPGLFKKLPTEVSSVLGTFIMDNIVGMSDWQKYQGTFVGEQKLDEGEFLKKWELAIENLKKVRLNITSAELMELFNQQNKALVHVDKSDKKTEVSEEVMNIAHLFKECGMLQSIMLDPNLHQLLKQLNEIWNTELRRLVATIATPERVTSTPRESQLQSVQVQATPTRQTTPTTPSTTGLAGLPPFQTPDYRSELGIARPLQDSKLAGVPPKPPIVPKRPKPGLEDMGPIGAGPALPTAAPASQTATHGTPDAKSPSYQPREGSTIITTPTARIHRGGHPSPQVTPSRMAAGAAGDPTTPSRVTPEGISTTPGRTASEGIFTTPREGKTTAPSEGKTTAQTTPQRVAFHGRRRNSFFTKEGQATSAANQPNSPGGPTPAQGTPQRVAQAASAADTAQSTDQAAPDVNRDKAKTDPKSDGPAPPPGSVTKP